MGPTVYPADFNKSAIEAAVVPFPMPEITPPETNMYFNRLVVLFDSGTIYHIKNFHVRQLPDLPHVISDRK